MIAPNYAMGYEQTGRLCPHLRRGRWEDRRRPSIRRSVHRTSARSSLRSIPSRPTRLAAVFAGSDAIKFVKQYAEYGLKGEIPLVGTILLTDDLILQQQGDAAIGITSASHYASALENPANKAFVEAYRKKFKRDPTLYSEASYRWSARDLRTRIEALERRCVEYRGICTATMRKA